MGKVVVVGSSNTDMVVRAEKIPAPGETIMGNEFDTIPGGKGANQAVAAARAGGEVTFIAKVGADDLGQKAIEGYEQESINTAHILKTDQAPSGVALIIVDETSGQNSIVVAPGANGELSPKNIVEAEGAISKADTVLLQLETPLETVQKALQLAKAKGKTTILNPAPARHLNDELLNLVDIITPNESETALLTGILPTNEQETMDAASALLKKVNQAVIITLGSAGVYYQTKEGDQAFVATTKVQAIDTTAAGDVFNGYLAAALSDGKSLRTAIELANKAAAISVTRKGAQPSVPLLSEI